VPHYRTSCALDLESSLGSGRWRRFPQFDAIALGIHDSAKATVFFLLDAIVDLDAFLPQQSEKAVQVGHAAIEHVRFLTGLEVPRVLLERFPNGITGSFGIFVLSPRKRHVTIRVRVRQPFPNRPYPILRAARIVKPSLARS
jgi:hypothetical protein